MIHPSRRRPGFTLIELITVVAIIIVLAGMIVGVAYTGSNKQITANGSSALVGWLKTAQAYALRDQKPYGLRLRADGSGIVTSFQYIEQPPEWVGPVGSTISSACAGQVATITGSGVDFSGGIGGSPGPTWAIQPGDYVECRGGQICRIQLPSGVVSSTQLNCDVQAGDNPLPAMWTFPGTSDFRIVRKPQAMIGADLLSLPAGVAVNTAANNVAPTSPLPPFDSQGNLDIIFAPNGSVITPGLPGRDMRFWVVDTTQQGFTASSNSFTGTPLIVTVAVRTGLVSVQLVGPSGNPYQFVADGKSSGY
jgi:prepilin-type N-terminal cleavage/methylation domain-containing protein